METKSEAVERIFLDCLFRDEELIDGKPTIEFIKPTPIVHAVGFHPDRVAAHRAEIIALLSGFGEEFYADGGGGMSFLNFCNLANGEQWTGLHLRMEQLLQLGEAIGAVSYPMPREFLSALPGGMPYVVIDRQVAA